MKQMIFASKGIASPYEATRKKFMKQDASRQGFSMIEMLLVIAIVLILASLVAPSVGKMRESGLRAACKANQRSIVTCAATYSVDNNQEIIKARFDGGNWIPKALNGTAAGKWADYGLFNENSAHPTGFTASSVWNCPSRKFETNYEAPYSQWVIGYQYFGGISTWKTPLGTVDSRSPVKASTADGGWAMTADSIGKISGVWGGGRPEAYGGMPVHRDTAAWPAGSNVGFWDGHVEWVDFKDMIQIHSWGWGTREFYSYQEDLGDYVPTSSQYGAANMF